MAARRHRLHIRGFRPKDNHLGAPSCNENASDSFSSQNADGKIRDTWGSAPIRLTSFSLTPDFKRLVAVGMEHTPYYSPSESQSRDGSVPPGGNAQPPTRPGHKVVVFDLATKQPES
jgi:hypothetical protein